MLLVALASFADYLGTAARAPRRARTHARAAWLHRTARRHLALLCIRPQVRGAFPPAGLLVANHLSYLDIVVLAAQAPCVFVAKKEVAGWPLFGAFARLGATLFVDRDRRGGVASVADEMRAVLAEGLVLVLFPEGTSSGGEQVLPFKTPLFEPVLALGAPITAAAFDYALAEGSVADEVCYWRDMTLLPHLLNVFAKPCVTAFLRIGSPRVRTGDRKQVARALHAEVTALRQTPAV